MEAISFSVIQDIWLRAHLSRTTVTAQLGHLIGLMPFSTRGKSIYWWNNVGLNHGRWRYVPFQLVTTGPSSAWPIMLHTKVKKWQMGCIAKSDNMDQCCTLQNIYCINTYLEINVVTLHKVMKNTLYTISCFAPIPPVFRREAYIK